MSRVVQIYHDAVHVLALQSQTVLHLTKVKSPQELMDENTKLCHLVSQNHFMQICEASSFNTCSLVQCVLQLLLLLQLLLVQDFTFFFTTCAALC